MNQSIKNICFDLITPICLILIAVFLRPALPSFEIAQTSVFENLPYVLLGISLLISWKFNQLDSFYLSIMLCVVYAATLQINLSGHNSNEFSYELYIAAISILFPLNFIIFKAWQVESTISASGIFRILLISGQSYGVFWSVQNHYAPLLDIFKFHILPDSMPLFESIPQIGIMLFILAALTQIGFIAVKQKPLDSTLLGALIAVFAACYSANEAFVFLSFFSAAAIMLVVATMQASYNMAFIDTLTGLPSRRAMETELNKLGRCYTIAMLDIDHFKKLNDTYGHDVGDQVLRMVATHIRRVGGGGRPARYGGEEFAVIFPSRSIIDAIPFLEVVRENIANASFALRDKDRPKKIPKTRSTRKKPANKVSVTISIGVAEKNRAHKLPAEVMKLADNALYKAKKKGRNCLCK